MKAGKSERREVGRSVQRGAAVILLLSVYPVILAAQYDECRPGPASHEAQTLGIFSVPLAFSGTSAPGKLTRVTLGLEASRVPSVDPVTATPTICRPGKGPENTDALPALARPRIGVPLPLGLALEASWIPPIRVNGVEANLFGFALTRSVGRADGITGALRAHATFGTIKAPVTCDESAILDPVSECFHGSVSDDRYSPNILGLELSVGWPMAGGRLRPYVGSGYNHLQPRFQVNFTNQFGQTDTTPVEVNLDRAVLFGGASWKLTRHLDISGEVYSSLSDAVTGRFVIRRALGS
jgi:hypothetical protein